MSEDGFAGNPWPTLGVEVELQLVDARTLGLRSGITEVLADLTPGLRDSVKPEFMQCYVEINSSVCRTVADLEDDLAPKLRTLESVAARHGLRLFWSATHPFSRWQHQRITPNDRYFRLAESLRETVVRPVTFGLHVHVGVPSGDDAIAVSNRLQRHLPLLLALSANSPFWEGRPTGHHAHRIEVLEGFPTGGLPPLLESWAAYCALARQMTAAGFIESPKDVWWDVRPNAASGTIEVRICDMPPDLPAVLALSALVQCLVHSLLNGASGEDERGTFAPLMVRQNRWRACRYGLNADLVDLRTLQPHPARRLADELVRRLAGAADWLGCRRYLEHVREIVASGTGAERQAAVYERTKSLVAVVRESVAHTALEPRSFGENARPLPVLPGQHGLPDAIVRPGALLS